MDILNINWKPNNTLEILLSNGSVITFTDVSFSNHLILSNNPTLLDKIILSKKHTNWVCPVILPTVYFFWLIAACADR